MRLLKSLLACIVVLTAAGATQAGFFDLALDDNAFELRGGFTFGKDPAAQFLIGGTYLYADDEETDLATVLAGWSGKPASNDEVDFIVGFQGYFGETGSGSSVDVEGFGVGGEGNWAPSNWKGVFVGGRAYYTPSLFATGDTNSILEFAVRGGYRINPKIQVFLEYASVEADIENVGDVDLNSSLLLGFGVRFGK